MSQRVQLQVDIPATVKVRLKKAAMEKKTSMTALVNEVLQNSSYGDTLYQERADFRTFFIGPLLLGSINTSFVFFYDDLVVEQLVFAYAAIALIFIQTLTLGFGLFSRHVSVIESLASITLNAILIIIVCAQLHDLYGYEVGTASHFSDSLYFSIVTWTTLGYGDYQPHVALRLLAAFQAVLGYLYLGVSVGLITAIASETIRTQEEKPR